MAAGGLDGGRNRVLLRPRLRGVVPDPAEERPSAESDEQARGAGDDERSPDADAGHEQPRRREGPEPRAGHVEGVEQPDRPTGLAHPRHHRPRQERQRDPHQEGRRAERGEVHEGGRPRGDPQVRGDRVEPVVVHPGARDAEGADPHLDEGEASEGGTAGEPRAPQPPDVAARAEAGHEGGHDHRDRVEPHPRVEREDALPGDLVDERRDPAEEVERGRDPEGPGVATGHHAQASLVRAGSAAQGRGSRTFSLDERPG